MRPSDRRALAYPRSRRRRRTGQARCGRSATGRRRRQAHARVVRRYRTLDRLWPARVRLDHRLRAPGGCGGRAGGPARAAAQSDPQPRFGYRRVPAARAIMLLRVNALACGHSGCRVELVERLLEMLHLGIHPRVPMFGSVGASGDLAPLAHVALSLLGEGRAEVDGQERRMQEALAGAGLAPVKLQPKEGLALIHGTQATTGLGVLALLAAERAAETADACGAMSVEALLGTPQAFREEIQRARASAPSRIRRPVARAHRRLRDPGVAPLGRSARAGRLLASLHPAGARRDPLGARLRAGHSGGRDQQRNRQSAGLPAISVGGGGGCRGTGGS